MNPVSCPHLGLQDDPETRVGFPSPRNYCWRSRPIEVVSLEHQNTTCLNKAYNRCPVLTNAFHGSLPDNLRLNQRFSKKKYLGITITVAGIVFVFVIALVWWQRGFLVQSAAPTIDIDGAGFDFPATIPPEQSTDLVGTIPRLQPTDSSTKFILADPTETLFSSDTPTVEFPSSVNTETNTSSPTLTASQCTPPPGWKTYIVQPGDSLFHIGLELGVTVADLQLANCMGNSVTIYAGQKLYVPNTPSHIPPKPFTATPTVSLPYSTKIAPPEATPTVIPTSIPLPTETSEPTNTPVVLPSSTEVPTPTLTPPPPV